MSPGAFPELHVSRSADSYERELQQLRADKESLLALCAEAAIQIRYLHDKFTPTGSGNAVLAKLDGATASAGRGGL